MTTKKSLFIYCLITMALVSLVGVSTAHASVSVDRFSPSLVSCAAVQTADTYLNVAPGTGGCDVAFGPGPVLDTGAGTYGLGANDNNVGNSNGEANPFASHIILFSVDGGSTSGGGTPVNTEALAGQAMGDVYRTVNPPAWSPAVSFAACAPSALGGGHALAMNQTVHNLIPTVAAGAANPFMPPAGFAPADNLDALEIGGFDITGDNVHDLPIYFVLDPASPSLGAALTPADVLLSPPGAAAFFQFAPAAMLGLTGADDVDALVVWDNQQVGNADPGADYALFSLAPGSPALAGPDGVVGTADDFSPADVFVTDFSGTFCPYLRYHRLRLRRTDNVDALDVVIDGFDDGGMGF